MPAFQTLPGFREFYPDALAHRNHIFRVWRRTANTFGFSEYDAPVLESLDLYKTKSGEEIEGQLFNFTDKGGREVALRPEMTPTVCRLVADRAPSLKRPIKWFSIAEFYRYERMQKGRGRSFFQFNADIFGEPGIETETELIALLVQCLRDFGLTHEDISIRLSDRNLWFHYLEALGLDEPLARTVLGAVDKYEKIGDDVFKTCAGQSGAPLAPALKEKILAFLKITSLEALETALAPCAATPAAARLGARLADWKKLLGNLAAMGLAEYISVDLGIVRGLAYYTGFVFEAFERKGELRALAGGGRYDDLAGKLGHADMPAAGFAIGDMTLGLLLEQRGLMPALVQAPDAYAIIGGATERLAAFADIHALRAAGFRVDYPMRETAFGKQFKAAAETGAKLALIYGSDELAKGVVKIRDMRTRAEQDIAKENLLATVRAFLSTA